MFRPIILFWILILNFFVADAQTFSISGSVKDDKETLPGASVYLAGTKIATLTGSDGRFLISNLAPGNYDLLVQMIGYLPFQIAVSIKNQSENINIKLKENVTLLNEVVIKPDANRALYLSWFRQHFIGASSNAKDCKILNPEVLLVDFNKTDKVLTVSGKDFMIIENKALGYRLKYLLNVFELDRSKSLTYYEGYPFFEEMTGSNAKKKKWKLARQNAYLGSKIHFFRALAAGTVQQSGFTINKLIEVANPNRLPDSLINAQIKIQSSKNNGLLALTFTKTDSLAFYLRERQKPKTILTLNRTAISPDTFVKSFNANLDEINFDHSLYVIYDAPTEDEYGLSGFNVPTPPDLGGRQISTMKTLIPPIRFFKNGEVDNPRSVLYSGYWSYKKIADFLPLDYKIQE